uniref:Uncharacterized protein n=1 Tax=Hippocampus comes TaxID=109280 RepID=A0A3Q3DCG4_HIPCM
MMPAARLRQPPCTAATARVFRDAIRMGKQSAVMMTRGALPSSDTEASATGSGPATLASQTWLPCT